MLDIVKAPNPVLSQKAKPIAKVDKAVLNLIQEMEQALDAASDPVGVGLAAPQVGKSLDIFVIKPHPKSKLQAFINPEIIKLDGRGDTTGKNEAGLSSEALAKEEPRKSDGAKKLEGCLSLVNIWGEVERTDNVLLEYTDETGKRHKKKFSGFVATIIQHEVDHLNGILFPKRVLEQKGTLYQSSKNAKGEDEFEELKI
jgi:peptide deformylase